VNSANEIYIVKKIHLDELEAIPFFEGEISALAFDFGLKKIGVAYGQSVTGRAKEVDILKARDGIPVWNDIAKIINDWKPNFLVIGLPYNLDGSSSELLSRAVTFAHRLNGRFELPCYGSDERLSSADARIQHKKESIFRKKSNKVLIDDMAAIIILEDWFRKIIR
jgi:putative Holliday junction resolvase